jgi:hypothetical protein
MYRRTWAATIEGQFPGKLARLGSGQGHLSETTRQDIGRSALILAPNNCDRILLVLRLDERLSMSQAPRSSS